MHKITHGVAANVRKVEISHFCLFLAVHGT